MSVPAAVESMADWAAAVWPGPTKSDKPTTSQMEAAERRKVVDPRVLVAGSVAEAPPRQVQTPQPAAAGQSTHLPTLRAQMLLAAAVLTKTARRQSRCASGAAVQSAPATPTAQGERTWSVHPVGCASRATRTRTAREPPLPVTLRRTDVWAALSGATVPEHARPAPATHVWPSRIKMTRPPAPAPAMPPAPARAGRDKPARSPLTVPTAYLARTVTAVRRPARGPARPATYRLENVRCSPRMRHLIRATVPAPPRTPRAPASATVRAMPAAILPANAAVRRAQEQLTRLQASAAPVRVRCQTHRPVLQTRPVWEVAAPASLPIRRARGPVRVCRATQRIAVLADTTVLVVHASMGSVSPSCLPTSH
jgi:hypothetical protein